MMNAIQTVIKPSVSGSNYCYSRAQTTDLPISGKPTKLELKFKIHYHAIVSLVNLVFPLSFKTANITA